MSSVQDLGKWRDSMNRNLRKGNERPYDGGNGGGNMEQRVARLEAKIDAIDGRLDRMENAALTKWDVAQVVFFAVGGLMAAAIFGPRIAAFIPATP